MSTRAFSLNDADIASPRLRQDQRVKIRNLVRNNADHPQVALGLVRDAVKGYDFTVKFSENEEGITVITKDVENKMYSTYSFRFRPHQLIETPTLD